MRSGSTPIFLMASRSLIFVAGAYSMHMVRFLVYWSYTRGTLIQSVPANCAAKSLALLASRW